MDRISYDNQLFSWRVRWQDGGYTQFKDVVLNVSVGIFPVGTQFAYARMSGDISLLTLIDYLNKEYLFDLKLTVGEAVELLEENVCAEGCTHHHSN